MSLVRAVANLITTKLDIPCFGGDLANTDDEYPWIEVAEIERETTPLGCGAEDYVAQDESGARTAVKVLEHRTTVRLTVHAAGTSEASGGDIAIQTLGRIAGAFEDAKRGKEPVILTDPETDEDEHVTNLAYAGRTFLPPDSGGEPVVHKTAASYRFTHRTYRKRPVENRIGRVTVRA